MAEGKFIITAQNKIKEGLDSAKKDLLGFEDAAKKVGDTLKAALTVTAIAAGLKKLGEAAFDCYKEFGEMDRRMQQLRIALDGNESSFQKASALIENMGRKSLASKDDIENLVTELASLGKSDKEIEAITTAAVNLSNVTEKDLNAAFTLINATYAGTTGKLTQLLPELDGLSKKQLEAGGATDLINKKFGELSTKLAADNIPQKLKNIGDSWGDLKETIGQSVAPLFNPLLEGFNALIGAINATMEARLLESQFDTLITAQEKKNSIERQIQLKKEYLEDQKSYRDLIMGTDMTGMLSATVGFSTLDESIKRSEAAIAKLEAQREELKLQNPNLFDIAPGMGRPVPLLNGNGDSGSGSGKSPLSLASDSLSKADQAWAARYNELARVALAPKGQGQSLEEFYGALDESIWGPLFDRLDAKSNPSEWTFNSQLSDAWQGIEGVIGGTTGEVRQVEGAINERSGNIEELLGDIWAGVEVVVGDIIKHGGRTDGGRVDAGAGLSGETLAFDYQNPEGMRDAESRYRRLWDRQEQAGAIELSTAQRLSEAWSGFQEGFAGVFLGTSGGVDSGLSAEIIPPSYWQRLTEQLSTGFSDAFSAVTAGMGSFASQLMGPIGEMLAALGPIGQMLAGMPPLLALLLPIIEGLVSVMGPAVTAVLQPVMDALTAIGQALGQLLLPIMDALAPTFALLGQMLISTIIPIIQILAPFMQIIALMFQMLAPVLGLFAKALIILMSPVEFLADLFTWLAEVIKTFAWNIAHPFDQKEGPGAFESDAFSGLAERLAAIDQLTANGQTLQDGYNPSADTASQSANYRVQSVTINVYQQAPVVGSGGMDEFVTMIRDRFQALEYFGAAA